jgi:hypothetical protein
LVTVTRKVVDMAAYGAFLATDTFTLHVPVVAGATRRPAEMRHRPEVTEYVRVPLDTVPTMRDRTVRVDRRTLVTYTVNPGRADTDTFDDDTAPTEFLVTIENV